jgi:hypothetical protein
MQNSALSIATHGRDILKAIFSSRRKHTLVHNKIVDKGYHGKLRPKSGQIVNHQELEPLLLHGIPTMSIYHTQTQCRELMQIQSL